MKRVYLCISFLILSGIYQTCRGQYVGGDGSGCSSVLYNVTPCPYGISTNIYAGGDAKGYSSNRLIVAICPPISTTNIYGGGAADGYASNSLIVTICPSIITTNIYGGGAADGYASNSLIVTICPPIITTNIYGGGTADGHANKSLIVTICPPISTTNIYGGGTADGHASNSLIVTICPPIATTNIFLGGTNDGWATKKIIQTVCPLSALPIELLFFDVTCTNNDRLFSWSTASETNNNYFTIENSKDASIWKKIATVNGAGNSPTKRNYSYLDLNSIIENCYYRLKQTDFDGKFNFSNLVYNDCNEEVNVSFNVFPNPSNGKINLVYNGSANTSHTVDIYNSIGEKVYRSNNFHLLIDLAQHPTGVYFIHISSDSQSFTKRIIIE